MASRPSPQVFGVSSHHILWNEGGPEGMSPRGAVFSLSVEPGVVGAHFCLCRGCLTLGAFGIANALLLCAFPPSVLPGGCEVLSDDCHRFLWREEGVSAPGRRQGSLSALGPAASGSTCLHGFSPYPSPRMAPTSGLSPERRICVSASWKELPGVPKAPEVQHLQTGSLCPTPHHLAGQARALAPASPP